MRHWKHTICDGVWRWLMLLDGPVDEWVWCIEIGKVPWQVAIAVRYHVHPHNLCIMHLSEQARPGGRWNRWRWTLWSIKTDFPLFDTTL